MNHGFSEPFRVFDAQQLADIFSHLGACRRGAGYIDRGNPAQSAAKFQHYSQRDILECPHFIEAITHPEIVAFAARDLGYEPVIYSVNAFWSLPSGTRSQIQRFHRDFDDDKFITLFLFLTTTKADDGAHLYMRGSHEAQAFEREIAPLTPVPLALFSSRGKHEEVHQACINELAGYLVPIHAEAGYGAWVDTRGLHCGGLPKTPRLLAWARYGKSGNDAYVKDGTKPIPIGVLGDARMQRLLAPVAVVGQTFLS